MHDNVDEGSPTAAPVQIGTRFATMVVVGAALAGLACSSSEARCQLPEGAVPSNVIDMFMDHPASILLNDGGSPKQYDILVTQMSAYMVANQSILPMLISVMPRASLRQKRAFGKALFRVVNLCGPTDLAMAMHTNAIALKIDDTTVVNAYREASAGAYDETAVSTEQLTSSFLSAPKASGQSLIGDPTHVGNLPDLKLENPFSPPELP